VSQVAVIAGYAAKACFPRTRRLGLIVPAVGALLFGLLSRALEDSPEEALALIAGQGLFGVVLPIGCLIIGDAVLGSEIRSGTMHYTWLSPASFRSIVLGRWLVGTGVAVVALAVPCALAAVVAGVPDGAGALGFAAAMGASAYIAVFVLLGAMTRRAVVWSLALVVLLERLLGQALSGIAQWCPGWVARFVYGDLGPDADRLLRSGVPAGGEAVTRLVIITVVALWLAARRLAKLRLSGPTDD
jgi:ABC-2 type transport system permease protein